MDDMDSDSPHVELIVMSQWTAEAEPLKYVGIVTKKCVIYRGHGSW